jgi:hypothetical protein
VKQEFSTAKVSAAFAVCKDTRAIGTLQIGAAGIALKTYIDNVSFGDDAPVHLKTAGRRHQ